ncbi:hypothetical protein [Abyssisolibacter fermentans]|uniref:hypothetical protein n=1 Tax=Abyssisolibacter fermentans TaxID=1766203 RepID=UPI00082E9607|nr:hypothetical protein [Abyssisolibacter fermentans]
MQYKEIINAINTRLNWDVHLSTLSVTGEFKNELNPLYSENEPVDRVFKLSDAMKLKNMASNS